jgi:hypothetical protein
VNPTTDIISLLGEFAKDAWNLRETLKKAKQERRERISVYFMNVHDCLIEIANRVDNCQSTRGTCAQLKMHANLLPSLLKGVLPDTDVQKLTEELHLAHETDYLYMLERPTPKPERDVQVSQLSEVAGYLKALSQFLHI